MHGSRGGIAMHSFSLRYPAALLGAAFIASCAGHAGAQIDAKTTSLDRVVVTATRSQQPLIDLIADVSYIGTEDITRAGAQSVAELLARVPGVEIASNGGPGSTTSVFLRGANRGHTLVLIDGLRVGSSSDGATALEAIPLEQIDHIEILRGPASSLYGADAIGGVIQIFTRKSHGALSVNTSGGYGTYGTGMATAGISGGAGANGWRFALQAGVRRSEGFNAIGNPANFSYNPDRDGYRDDSASGSLAYRFAPDQELAAQFFRSRLNAQFDAGLGFDDRTITTLSAY